MEGRGGATSCGRAEAKVEYPPGSRGRAIRLCGTRRGVRPPRSKAGEPICRDRKGEVSYTATADGSCGAR